MSNIADRLTGIRERIAAAARSTGRDPSSIRLVAVSKTFPIDAIREAYAAGHRDFGENRVQEGVEKRAQCSAVIRWELIGHLQSNKARKAAGAFAWIHSIDSLELLRKLDTGAVEAGTRPRVLIQVDLAREQTKFGADLARVADLARAAANARAVELRGLMIIPPIPEDPEQSRPWFVQLRELRDRLVTSGVPASSLRELSMGMSQDFEVAIEEGATIVRVGTSIFGHR